MALTIRFEEALAHAARIHAGRSRKGGDVPSVSHLLAVASLAMEAGADEDEVIAALLHDAVEDQGGRARLEDIRWRFGDAVADIVHGCSDSDVAGEKAPWADRKQRFLEKLRTAPESVRLVVACDKLHNLRSLVAAYRESGEDLWSRFKAGREETLEYARRVLEELSRTVAEATPGYRHLVEEARRTEAELRTLTGAAGGSAVR